MPTFKVTAPSNPPATVDQVGAVQLIDGMAECNDASHASELRYFRQAGYLVEQLDELVDELVDQQPSS